MPCADCFTKSPDTFQAFTEDGEEITGYWFMVHEDKAADVRGVMPDGEFAFAFQICATLKHPELRVGQEALCSECFDKRFPMDDEPAFPEGGNL